MRLPRRVDHGEFDVLDEGKKAARVDPYRVVSEESADSGAGADMPRWRARFPLYRRQANNIWATVSGTWQSGHWVYRPFLAVQKIAVRGVRMTDTQSA